MKVITTIALFMSVSLSGTALAEEASPYEGCKAIASVASTIMKSRQIGVPLTKVLDWAESHEKFTEMLLPIVKSAYRVPKFSTEKYQTRAALEFENKVMLECLDVMADRGTDD